MIKLIDDFFLEPEAELEKALRQPYEDYHINYLVYPQIAICEKEPLALKQIEQIVSAPLFYSIPPHYRKYYAHSQQPTFIHSDVNEGDYTCVVFLNKVNENNGIAFWEHLLSGKERANKLNVGAFEKDGLDETKWSQPVIVPAQFNRAVIFDSALFHSRWPRNMWTIGDDEARLIKVMFFKESAK